MAAHDPAGLGGHARAQGVAFEDEDVGFTAFSELVGDGKSFETAADDQEAGGVRHVKILVVSSGSDGRLALAICFPVGVTVI